MNSSPRAAAMGVVGGEVSGAMVGNKRDRQPPPRRTAAVPVGAATRSVPSEAETRLEGREFLVRDRNDVVRLGIGARPHIGDELLIGGDPLALEPFEFCGE